MLILFWYFMHMRKQFLTGLTAQAVLQNMEPWVWSFRSMSGSTDNFPHTGAMIYNDSFPKIPALAIGLQDADKLAAAVVHHKKI